MIIYRDGETPSTYTQNGPGNSAAMLKVLDTTAIPTAVSVHTITGATEKKKQERRVLIRCTGTIPSLAYANTSGIVQSGAGDIITAHVVLTCPERVVSLRDSSADGASIVDEVLETLIRTLATAISGTGCLTNFSVNGSENPLMAGLRGLAPLDVNGGEYGKAV